MTEKSQTTPVTIVVCTNATHDRDSALALGMKVITHILNGREVKVIAGKGNFGEGSK